MSTPPKPGLPPLETPVKSGSNIAWRFTSVNGHEHVTVVAGPVPLRHEQGVVAVAVGPVRRCERRRKGRLSVLEVVPVGQGPVLRALAAGRSRLARSPRTPARSPDATAGSTSCRAGTAPRTAGSATGSAARRSRRGHPSSCQRAALNPWIAAKNRQLVGSASARCFMAATPRAYHRIGLGPRVAELPDVAPRGRHDASPSSARGRRPSPAHLCAALAWNVARRPGRDKPLGRRADSDDEGRAHSGLGRIGMKRRREGTKPYGTDRPPGSHRRAGLSSKLGSPIGSSSSTSEGADTWVPTTRSSMRSTRRRARSRRASGKMTDNPDLEAEGKV